MTTTPAPDATMDRSVPALGWLAAMGQPTRLLIVHALADGERCVGEIAAAVGAALVNVSHHLGVLHRAGVLARRKDGRTVYYAVAGATVAGGVLTLAAHGATFRMRLAAGPEVTAAP